MNRISIQQMEFDYETYPNMNTSFSLCAQKAKTISGVNLDDDKYSYITVNIFCCVISSVEW